MDMDIKAALDDCDFILWLQVVFYFIFGIQFKTNLHKMLGSLLLSRLGFI